MDYTSQPLPFKLHKAARYLRLYGISRTLVKAKSYYHMNKRYAELPNSVGPADGRHVGIIGCGKFAYAHVAHYLRKNFGDVIRAGMDIDIHRAASLFEGYRLTYFTDDAQRVIDDPAVDTIFIVSNHASHTEYAIPALELGKTVHIEKPHVVSADQLHRLTYAMERSGGRVALGFNRPLSRIGRAIAQALNAESGPAMMNWFVAGHEIPPDHWYCSPEEGGRVLGNLCHWTDFVLRLIAPEARFPIEINPTRVGNADSDIAVTYTFGDGTIAAITFVSSKGHAFEGVRERFAAQRGNTLITMDDFKTLTIDVGEKRVRTRNIHRDHGHEQMICDSYRLGRDADRPGATADYVWETGQLFLSTRDALELGTPVTVRSRHDALASTVSLPSAGA